MQRTLTGVPRALLKYRKEGSVYKSVPAIENSMDSNRRSLVILDPLKDTITNCGCSHISHHRDFQQFRGNKFRVSRIVDMEDPSLCHKKVQNKYYRMEKELQCILTEYILGEVIEIADYSQNLEVSGRGIHYFETIDAAYHWGLVTPPKDYTGVILDFDRFGVTSARIYQNGVISISDLEGGKVDLLDLIGYGLERYPPPKSVEFLKNLPKIRK